MTEKKNPFFDICRRELNFLREEFDFKVLDKPSDKNGMFFRMENVSLGVVVEFEPQFVYPRLYLYLLSSPKERLELNTLLKQKAPDMIFPTSQTERFLSDMVQAVVAGKKMNVTEYPEDISFDNVISKYALALRKVLPEMLYSTP